LQGAAPVASEARQGNLGSIAVNIAGNFPRNFSIKGGTREWHLDKEILEKNARNKIRVHQCLPIVEKILEKPK